MIKKNTKEIVNNENINVKYDTIAIYLNGHEINSLIQNEKIVIKNDVNKIQRKYVEWNNARKKEYYNTLINNFPHNPIYLLQHPNDNNYYVVDGQHRLLTIQEMVKDEADIFGPISEKVFEVKVIKVKVIKAKSEEIIDGDYEEFWKIGKEIFRILNDTHSIVTKGTDRRIRKDLTDKQIKALKLLFPPRIKDNEKMFRYISILTISMGKQDEKDFFVSNDNEIHQTLQDKVIFHDLRLFLEFCINKKIVIGINNKVIIAALAHLWKKYPKVRKWKIDLEFLKKIKESNKNLIKKNWAKKNTTQKRIAFTIFAIKKIIEEGKVVDEFAIKNHFEKN